MEPDDGLGRARFVVRLFDEAVAVPGTRFRVGLDGLLGLIPGIGDALSALPAVYLVGLAARRGVPRTVLARMVGIVLVDVVVGAIPVLGDAFDLGFKAHRRNLTLLEAHATDPGGVARRSRAVVVVVGAVLAVVVGLAALLLGKALG